MLNIIKYCLNLLMCDTILRYNKLKNVVFIEMYTILFFNCVIINKVTT